MARAERDDGLRRSGIDHLARGGRPAGRLGHHPEDRRLVQANLAIAGPNAEDHLLWRDRVAVVKGFDLRHGEICLAQDVTQQVFGLVDPAQDRLLAGEDLHRDERVEALALENARSPGEIDVRRVPGHDLARRSRPCQTHQPASLEFTVPPRLPERQVPVRRRRPVGRRV